MSAPGTISLIVMTYNRPVPLARCLESIEALRCNGPRPEIIVVDDGSDPPAEEVVDRYPSLEILSVRQEHRGVASARNLGLKTSTGAFVGFIADDYVLPPGYLEDVAAFFRQYPDAQVISHNVDPRGSRLLRPVQKIYFDLVIGQEVPPDQAGRDVIRSYTLPASRAAMFRWEVFEKVGRFDEQLLVGEDGDFGQRMAKAGIPVHLFLRKRVIHHDAVTTLDYFRQRIRYGRSYLRSGIAGPTRKAFVERGFLLAMAELLWRKLRQWWEVSGRIGLRLRFVSLSPFLLLFLCFFYYGAYLELRDTTRTRNGS